MSDKILFIGDPHIQTTNLPEVDILLEKLIHLIITTKPNFIVLGGDVLDSHEKLYTLALNKAIDFMKTLAEHAHLYVLVGNHDYIKNQEFLSNNHWMYAIKNFHPNVTIVDRVITVQSENVVQNGVQNNIKNGTYWFCPYVPNGRFEEALQTNTKLDYRTDPIIIFAHQEFFGCKMGAFNSIDGDHWKTSLPLVISGHIHNRQKPQDNIFYPGASLQQAFGESDKNIVAMIMVEESGASINIKEIDLQLPRKRTEYISANDFTPDEIEKISDRFTQAKDKKDKTKLVITGDDNDFKTIKQSREYKNLVEDGMKIVFKPKIQKKSITSLSSLSSMIDNTILSEKNDEPKNDEPKNDEPKYIKILNQLVASDNDRYLYSAYQRIVHNRNIIPESVIMVKQLVTEN